MIKKKKTWQQKNKRGQYHVITESLIPLQKEHYLIITLRKDRNIYYT